MGDWSLLGSLQQLTALPRPGSTAHASGNTKGVWVEIIAATTVDACGILLNVGRTGSAATDILIDLAIGAAGSELAILNNLLVSTPTNPCFGELYVLSIPIHIPAGTRLSFRSQAFTAIGTASLFIHLISGGFLYPQPASLITTYGAATADSGGTPIDPGSSVNTKGAYVQMTAACSRIRAFFWAIGSARNAAVSYADWLVDVAVGVAGSEHVIVPDLFVSAGVVGSIRPKFLGPIPMDIPEGSRIAVRAQCTINDATDRLFDLILYGIS